MTEGPVVPGYPQHSWLAAVLPAEARRLRVGDDALRTTLAHAGAELVDSHADAEIGPGLPNGDAPYVVVTRAAAIPDVKPRALRAGSRVGGSLLVRARARAVQTALRRRGYRTRVVLWEWEQPVRLPGARPAAGLGVPARFPLGAAVLGAHGAWPETAFARIVRRAGIAGADDRWPLARQGVLIAVGESAVLRTTIGPARRQLQRVQDALETLAAARPPASVLERVPTVVGAGREGLADWLAERRLPGREPARVEGALLEECCDFLAALHSLGAEPDPAALPSRRAQIVAAVAPPETRESVRALGRALDERLAQLPRGFAHGDFSSVNLLVRDGRLAGVIDWDTAGPGRLPVLDLLHLRLSARRARTRQYLGPAVVEHLLPWASAGGDGVTRRLCERLGVPADAGTLEALAAAYWLDSIAGELDYFADRVDRPVWMRENVDLVARSLAAGGLPGGDA